MLTLVPLTQFRVSYTSVAGRPYSGLEKLLLEAIASGLKDLAALEAVFRIHRRLLVESVVTLTLAGWVAVSDGGLVLTGEGRAAVSDEGKVPRIRIFRDRYSLVAMERLAGALAPRNQSGNVRPTPVLKREGLWDDAVRLRPRVHDRSLDAGEVDHLLPRDSKNDEWIQRVGEIQLLSRDGLWLMVDVEPESGVISHCPRRWAHLEDEIRRALREDHGMSIGGGTIALAGTRHGAERAPLELEPISVEMARLLTSPQDHIDQLMQALREAESYLFILSSFLRVEAVEELSQSIWNAVERGVRIGLLWGYDGNQRGVGPDAVPALEELARGAGDRLEFNRSAVGSHGKVLLWDTPEGARTCIGSYNWLSSIPSQQTGRDPINVSIVTDTPSILIAVAQSLAGLWRKVDRPRLPASSVRASKLAGAFDELRVERGGSAERCATGFAFVRDRQHPTLLRDCLVSADRRLLVTSFGLNDAAFSRALGLRDSLGQEAERVLVYGQTDLTPLGKAKLGAAAASLGARLTCVPGLHAKVVVADDVVYVGSYNFLSADVYDNLRPSQEVGVVLRNREHADAVWSLISGALPT